MYPAGQREYRRVTVHVQGGREHLVNTSPLTSDGRNK